MRRVVLIFATVLALSACDGAVSPETDTSLPKVRHPDTRFLEPAVREALAAARNEGDFETLGRVYLAHHLTTAAADCFARAYQSDKTNIDARYLFGVASAELGHNDVAAGAFRDVLAARPAEHFAAYRLGELLLRDGDLDQATAPVTQAVAALEKNAAVQALAGELALAQSRYAEASEYFQRALQQQPSATRLYHPLARALRGQGMTDTQSVLARAGAGEVRLFDPRMAAVAALSRSSQMLLERGKAHVSARDYVAAERAFFEATEQNPDDVFAWASLGRTREVLGDVDGARAALDRALEVDASSATAQMFLGMLNERQGDDVAAIVGYRSALRSDAQSVRARLLLAHALMRTEAHDEAQEAYSAVAAARPSNLLARYYLALLHLAYGRCDAAARALTEAAQIKANYGPVLEAQVRHAAVCDASPSARREALTLAGQLEQARPDVRSAVTRAMVLRSLGQTTQADEARTLALQRSGSQRAEVLSLLPESGGLTTAWRPQSAALKPTRLGADSL